MASDYILTPYQIARSIGEALGEDWDDLWITPQLAVDIFGGAINVSVNGAPCLQLPLSLIQGSPQDVIDSLSAETLETLRKHLIK